MDNSSGFGLIWADLPLSSGMAFRGRAWKRGRTWRSASGEGKDFVLNYRREPAVAVVIGAAAHEALKGWLAETAETWRLVEKAVQAQWPDGFKRMKGKKAPKSLDPSAPVAEIAQAVVSWSPGDTEAVVNQVRAKAIEGGVRPGSTSWATREGAAKAASRVFKGFVDAGRPPYLDMAPTLPGALSVRLAAGSNFDRPLRLQDGWLWLEDLGWAHPSEGVDWPDGVAAANYVEAAHIEQTWRLRFVFVNVVAKESRKPKVDTISQEERDALRARGKSDVDL
jgi:hypothetical protein